jgi:membrane protease YdiL (CAAX protease family)
MSSKAKLKFLAVFLTVIYFLFEHVFTASIESLGSYALYGIELLWVAVIFFTLKGFNFFPSKMNFRWLIAVLVAGLMGAWVQLFAAQSSIVIPFDFSSQETLLLLLLVGPLLEEIVFRYGLFRLLDELIPKKWIVILVSALFFSFAHFQAIVFMPPEMHVFIYYQAFYTLILGLMCGFVRGSYGMVPAILTHILFNFGFWLAR